MKKIMIPSILLVLSICMANLSFAHCDTRNGPVVKAAKEAIRTNNVKLVLIWVQEKDESQIKSVFAKTMAIRKTSKEVQEVADEYFFETVVRLHRMGEGESYTGLTDEAPEASVLLAEQAIERKSADSISNDLTALVQQGLDKHLLAALKSYYYDPNNIKAGREYVASYIRFVYYVDGLYKASENEMTEHVKHEDKTGLALTGVASSEQLKRPGWMETQFYLLLISALILMALLMIIVLILDKNLRYKNPRHDFHNGMAQHLA